MGGKGESQLGEVGDDGRAKAGCYEPDIGLRFARRAESPSEFDSSGGIGACETSSSANVSTAVIEVTSLPTRQEHLTASGTSMPERDF